MPRVAAWLSLPISADSGLSGLDACTPCFHRMRYYKPPMQHGHEAAIHKSELCREGWGTGSEVFQSLLQHLAFLSNIGPSSRLVSRFVCCFCAAIWAVDTCSQVCSDGSDAAVGLCATPAKREA